MAEHHSRTNESGHAGQPEKLSGKEVERVGVIIVHGIGEQKRFEFLEEETRNIVDAVIREYGPGAQRRLVTSTLTTGTGDAFLGEHSSWASGANAPLHVLVEINDSRVVDIAFHEVWWADINEALTLCKQVRFWAWGLSLSGIAKRTDSALPDAASWTRPPDNAGWLPWYNRWRMAFVSMLFGFSAFSIALVNVILKRLSFQPFPLTAIIVNYLSGVKLYSQDKRAGGSPMDGPDEPPRAAIRRRMIRVMVDVAVSGYDRWYILAHSLGTVVAWNGLMETEAALPNYLDRECWEGLGQSLRGIANYDIDIDAMMPGRPLWLGPRDVVRRDALFANFRGLLTYGSPLERFCALWSPMVPINKEEDVFRSSKEPDEKWSAEWINVYDPTDPVGTWLYDYNPDPGPARSGRTKLTPHNFPCRASWILLYSHLCYFRTPRSDAPDKGDYLVNQVARWLVTGKSLTNAIEVAVAKRKRRGFWLPRDEDKDKTEKLVFGRVIWRGTQDAIVAIVLTLLTLFSLNKAIYPAGTAIANWLHASWFTAALDRLLNVLSFGGSFWVTVAGVANSLHASWLTAAIEWLLDFLFRSHPYLKNVLIEIVVLLFTTATVITVASCIQYVSSTKDHAELKQKYAARSRHAQLKKPPANP